MNDHLSLDDKRATIAEIYRVLRPGGRVEIADWGQPSGWIQRLAFYPIQWLDGFETTRDHVTGTLVGLFDEAGFTHVAEQWYLRALFGTLRFLGARKLTG